jgi:hypothetical protein
VNEADNTFRVLREEPLLVTSVWCRFGLHIWQKWEKPPQKLGIDYFQIRYCDSCGIFKQKKVASSY